MQKIKVSVLIPVYNSEKTLKRCLDSVLNQTLEEIEIIITNDGSNDNSEILILEYLKKDKRIVYTKQKNSGLGATRNKGIEIARGEYIAFLDSDDWVDYDYYEILYKKAKEKNYDLVISSYITEVGENKYINKNKVNDKNRYLKNLLKGEIQGFSWNKLYKRKLIRHNNLVFPLRGYFENVEDQYFSIRAVYYSENISFVDNTNIHYIFNSMSIVNNYQKGLINDIEKLQLENEKLFANNKELLEISYMKVLSGIIQIVNNEFKKDNKQNYQKSINIFKDILDKDIFKKSFKYLKKEKLNYKDYIYLKLIIKRQFFLLYCVAKLRCKIIRLRGM